MISQSLSQRINSTRFIMILGVIAIHCNIVSNFPVAADSHVTQMVVNLFSSNLPSLCVPFFFFISAYLFQTKHSVFTTHSYLQLLKKRYKNILIPYVLWNTVAVLFWYAVNITPLRSFTSGGPQYNSILSALGEIYLRPALIPLWFLRNLMIFIVISPILQFLLNRIPIIFIILAFLCDKYILSGLFYYACGMTTAHIWSTSQFENSVSRASLMAIIYCIIKLLITIFDFKLSSLPLLNELINIFGIFGFIGICSHPLYGLNKINNTGATFFVYSFHGIISPYVIKSMPLLINWHGNMWVIDYLLTFTTTASLSFATYYVCIKYFPRITYYLIGGRQTDALRANVFSSK